MSAIRARVFRFDPSADSEPRHDEFHVETATPMSVQAIVRHIQRELDPTLAFRNYSCYLGVCACCLVRIGGKAARSCCAMVEPGEEVAIEPADRARVIRDLATVL